MQAALQKKGETALKRALPSSLRDYESRVEILQKDGIMVVHFQNPKDSEKPLLLLRQNGTPATKLVRSPIVVDPRTGCPAQRYTIPYRVWVREKILHKVLEEEPDEHMLLQDMSAIRRLKGVSENVDEHIYGRSGRLTILFDRFPLVVAAQVFPGGMFESEMLVSQLRLEKIGWILLKRSGISVQPYSFHMLRGDSFFSVERALNLPNNIRPELLRSLEKALIRDAEEDREIISAMLSSKITWETFL